MSAFEAACSIVIGSEGERGNDFHDPGGLTVFGHDQTSWPDLLDRVPIAVRAQLPHSVDTLTYPQSVLAYKSGYWDFVCGDDLPPPLALLLFDATVNQGTYWAPSVFQSTLGVYVDGDIGPGTVKAAVACDVNTLSVEFTYRRLLRYRQSSNYLRYGHGWETRAIRTVMFADVYTTPSFTAAWLPHIGTVK